MPKTLADMTPEERDQCRGMWCDTPKYPEIILLKPMFDEALGWSLLIPGEAKKVDYPHAAITPRFDLPRAWNADGTPVAAAPEEYTADGYSRVYPEGIEKVAFPPGTTVRRWVSDWEAVE